MKKLLTTLSILIIATASYAQTYIVERVIDGDILKLTNGEEVQLIGVETLKDEKMGQKATEFVKDLELEDKEVRLAFDVQEKDKNGRFLAYVYKDYNFPTCTEFKAFPGSYIIYDDNECVIALFINATIIKSGYAIPMTISPNVKYSDLFKDLYDEAREQKKGLWGDNPIDTTIIALMEKYKPENAEGDANEAFENNDLRFMCVMGYTYNCPFATEENLEDKDRFVLPQTSDAIVDMKWQETAKKYAQRYNKALLGLTNSIDSEEE